MAIRLIVYLEVFPGKRDEMLAAYAHRSVAIRAEPGCLEFRTLQDIENPDRFVLIEGWADEDAFTAHTKIGPNPEAVDVHTLRKAIGGERYEYEPTVGKAS